MWCPATITLAGADGAVPPSADIVPALIWLSVAAVTVAVAFWLIRRWLSRPEQNDTPETGFTLSDLRQLHRDGQLTDEQFKAAKAALIARGLAAMGGLDDEDEEAQDSTRKAHESRESNANGLSDGSLNSDQDQSSDKSGADDDDPNASDDAPPKRDE